MATVPGRGSAANRNLLLTRAASFTQRGRSSEQTHNSYRKCMDFPCWRSPDSKFSATQLHEFLAYHLPCPCSQSSSQRLARLTYLVLFKKDKQCTSLTRWCTVDICKPQMAQSHKRNNLYETNKKSL